MADRPEEGLRQEAELDREENNTPVKPKLHTGAVGLTYLAPPADLSAMFGPLYYFFADKPDVTDHTRAELAQIRFMISGTGDYQFGDGSKATTPTVCLLGPTNMATKFEVAGPLRVFGVGVLPLGWIAMRFGDASQHAENVFDLARSGRDWTNMLHDLRAVSDPEEAAALIWPFLRARIHRPTPAERAFVTAADAWLTDEQSPQIGALHAATGLSARQVARLCNRYYGAPPKYLARKYRALRCALILARDNVEWTDLLGDVFYDQSHFIREFKHFIGLTPSQLRANASIVMRLTMGRRDVEDIAPLSKMS